MSRVVAAGFVVLWAGCGPGTANVTWNITFETPALSARAVRVVATVHDGDSCAGAMRYRASIPNGATAMTTPASLRPGQYTICADAIDDACTIFAAGQTTVDLRGQVRHVDVVVAPAASMAACPGAACDHGECAASDGGVVDMDVADAGDATVPFDAGTDFGVDMSFDMGCPTHVVPTPAAGSCSSGTLSCLDGCFGDTACEDACIAADSVTCQACLYDSYDSCAVANGCQASADAFFCCAPSCGDPTSPACCPTEQTAWNNCLDAAEGACGSSQFVCFP